MLGARKKKYTSPVYKVSDHNLVAASSHSHCEVCGSENDNFQMKKNVMYYYFSLETLIVGTC